MRLLKFSSIKRQYREYYKQFYLSGKVPLKDTKLGMWGVSSADDVFEIFKKLAVNGKFMDLGSGDGKVVMIASLFCDSVSGIECDDELVKKSQEFALNLKIDANFMCDDYMNLNLSGYNWLFVNPDQELDKLEKKFVKELSGKVIVYSNLYFLKNMKIEKEFEISGIKVRVYSK
ncbi:MAG: hypothetical protein U9R08_02240 [Nanoarchaeota archaeon]|nr:hypothetical protein [Nanoarchaeota archaeon]